MKPDITFSVNEYDRDGDCISVGVFLHFGDTKVKVANSVYDFPAIVQHIEAIRDEIQETYGDGK